MRRGFPFSWVTHSSGSMRLGISPRKSEFRQLPDSTSPPKQSTVRLPFRSRLQLSEYVDASNQSMKPTAPARDNFSLFAAPDGLPIPPQELRHLISGDPNDTESSFFDMGRHCAQRIVKALKKAEVEIDSFDAILVLVAGVAAPSGILAL